MTPGQARVIEMLNAKRGGKGRVSRHERRLARALGMVTHVVLPTGRGKPYPRHYTIDLADPVARIAIEVDGPSHRTLWVQAADRRKTRLLRSLGWSVLRCTNDDVRWRFDATVARLARLVARRV